MSIFEYDREWEEELLRKEEFEAGREEERKNTEKERRRADSEKLRADNAERELLYLKEKLALLEGKQKIKCLPSREIAALYAVDFLVLFYEILNNFRIVEIEIYMYV